MHSHPTLSLYKLFHFFILFNECQQPKGESVLHDLVKLKPASNEFVENDNGFDFCFSAAAGCGRCERRGSISQSVHVFLFFFSSHPYDGVFKSDSLVISMLSKAWTYFVPL